MLSDDITYNVCVVVAVRERLVQHLKDKGIKVSHLIEWCDGAGSQYKLAQAFFHISEDAAKYGIEITVSMDLDMEKVKVMARLVL